MFLFRSLNIFNFQVIPYVEHIVIKIFQSLLDWNKLQDFYFSELLSNNLVSPLLSVFPTVNSYQVETFRFMEKYDNY